MAIGVCKQHSSALMCIQLFNREARVLCKVRTDNAYMQQRPQLTDNGEESRHSEQQHNGSVQVPAER